MSSCGFNNQNYTTMRTNVLFTLIVLLPCVWLMDGCKQNKKLSVKDAEPEVFESAKPEKDDKVKGVLEVRSGIIEYIYSGDKTGKSTHYFDDYGMKSAVYTDFISQGEENKGWAVSVGDDQYMWDPSNPGQGMKTKNPTTKMMKEASGKDIMTYMSGVYEQMGMTESGKEMFQGKECTVFQGNMGKALIWKGIMMRMEMNIGTIVSRQEVTAIKTNIPVDGKYFRIPENIHFSEIQGF